MAEQADASIRDDLSGASDAAGPVQYAANAALRDARWRSRYRTLATFIALLIITALAHALLRLVFELAGDISKASLPLVAAIASMLVAISALVIALLRATFMPSKADSAPAVDEGLLPGSEQVKLARDLLDVLAKKA